MFVKPKAGLSVPDPTRNDLLPAEGREVVEGIYWYRRLEEGDVTEIALVAMEKSDDSSL
jgi:hypothetical protein